MVLLRKPLVSSPLENSSKLFMLTALLLEADSLVLENLPDTGRDIWLMLMLVARKLELTAARGPEAGLEEESERLPEAAEAAAWEAGPGRGRAESLATWVILARSPWLLASSLIVSMMETVCTWPLPPFILILALVSSN